MDLYSELITTPYAFHGLVVGAVVLLALSVFVFGFKSAEEPPFDKLTDDRRGAAGKKKKVKDKVRFSFCIGDARLYKWLPLQTRLLGSRTIF